MNVQVQALCIIHILVVEYIMMKSCPKCSRVVGLGLLELLLSHLRLRCEAADEGLQPGGPVRGPGVGRAPGVLRARRRDGVPKKGAQR